MRNKKRLVCISLILIIILSGMAFAQDISALTDTVAFFKNVHIRSNEEVHGCVVAIFGNVKVDGVVYEDVVSIFGNTTVNGLVNGTVVTVIGGVQVNSGAIIGEEVVQVLGGRINAAPDSQIRGSRVGISSFGIPGVTGLPLLILLILTWTLIKQIFAYIMSVIAILVFPQRFDNMASWASVDISRRFLVGILVMVGYYVVLFLLLLVVLGIPFVLLLLPIITLLGFTGNTVVKLAIGDKIGRSMNKSFSPMMSLFVGTLAYTLIELTIIGKSATFVAKAAGIGAVIDSNIGGKKVYN